MIKEEHFLSVKGIIFEQLGGYSDMESSSKTNKIIDELKAYIKHNSDVTSKCVIAVIDGELCFGRVNELTNEPAEV